MDLFFRKYFWTVHLVFIGLAAYMVARTANSFLEAAILPLPKSGAVRNAGERRPPVEKPAQLGLERIAQLMGLPLPPPEPEVKDIEPAADYNSAPVKTSLRVKLLGTLIAAKPDWSIASILDLSNQRAQTFMTGDKVQGAEILEIERERVIIFNSRRREFIGGDEASGAVAAYTPPPVRPPTMESPTVTGSGIKALSENDYEVPRSEIDKTLSNLNDVAMQARIVPAFKDGQAQGFKLFSIRPDSLYTKIGIQNGDVIRRINGYDLNSPEKALEIYSKLKEANRIDIQIERNGSVLNKTYNIH